MKSPHTQDRLTTRQFWVDYWARTKAEVISSDIFFKDLLHFFPKTTASFLEIGGFPGATSTYFKKFHNYNVTLLDFVIVQEIIADVEKVNGLKAGDIQTIEGDLFDLNPEKKFDVVLSAGFIEHFKDTDAVFHKHVDYTNQGGTLFISLPNFYSVTGLAQKIFDRANYDVHNLDCMEKSVLRDLCQKYNLEIQYLEYFGLPHVWLDTPEKHSTLTKKLFYVCNLFLSTLHKLSGGLLTTNRFFAPFIVLIAKKSS